MPGKHVAPRHRSPQSFRRSLGRFAGDVSGRLPASALARSAVIVGAASLAVGAGVVTVQNAPAAQSVASSTPRSQSSSAPAGRSATYGEADSLLAAHVSDRLDQISRSEIRPALVADAKVQRATKSAALSVTKQAMGGSMTTSVPRVTPPKPVAPPPPKPVAPPPPKPVAPAPPKEIAMSLLSAYGWDSGQFSCLDALWTRESNWNPYASNVSSGAYGIPQALPGSKMATIAGDWATNAETQIKWGLGYIRASYGSPCGAWGHSQSYGWY